MGYLHINNLYKDQTILLFKEAWALEKCHGTSAHISYDGNLRFFSGGEKHDNFVKLFNQEKLLEKFKEIYNGNTIIIFGEAYGGKQQGMSDTYGPNLKFIVFDVKIGERWLSVPKAEAITKQFELEFAPYDKTTTDLSNLDYQRDRDSIIAINNGMGIGKKREGIVLRPLEEMTLNNGERVIAKHKRDDFRETKTPRPIVDPSKLQVLEDAQKIADEWVTQTRLIHVLDKIPDYSIEKTAQVIQAMKEDIVREAKGEIVINDTVLKTIGKFTAVLFKDYIKNRLY